MPSCILFLHWLSCWLKWWIGNSVIIFINKQKTKNFYILIHLNFWHQLMRFKKLEPWPEYYTSILWIEIVFSYEIFHLTQYADVIKLCLREKTPHEYILRIHSIFLISDPLWYMNGTISVFLHMHLNITSKILWLYFILNNSPFKPIFSFYNFNESMKYTIYG